MASPKMTGSGDMVSHNPTTGEELGTVPVTDPGQIPTIVEKARAAAADWRERGIDDRLALLANLEDAVRENAESLALLIAREMGKPLTEARAEVESIAAKVPSELAELREAVEPTVQEGQGVSSTVYRDPLGVCAAITPWNFPLAMPHWMAFPALAVGNTVVLKPSEETPLCGQAYADLLAPFLPDGVLQVVHGDNAQGKALVASDVQLIAFTGSRETGKAILANASSGLKRTILELGGKDPLIVLDDANLGAAADFALWNAFRNTGQVCVSTERIYVEESVASSFAAMLAARVEALEIGDPTEETTTVGPMVNQRQREHVLEHLRDACASGAQVLVGGGDHPDRYVNPTVLTDVSDDMPIVRDETFGPVTCIIPVADQAEAIQRANDTPFGLGAVVFGEQDRATEVARSLTAGMVGINRTLHGAPGTPWVGALESGFGFHKSVEGHRQFTQPRVVSYATA